MGALDKIRAWIGRAGARTITEPSAYSGAPPSYAQGSPVIPFDGSKYAGGLSNTGARMYIEHATLRTNARTAYHDSVQARAFVHRFADAVIDTGLKLEPQPAAEILGITEDYAEQWARDVEARFDAWASNKNATRDGTCNLYQLQRLAEICQQRDGEFFARLYYDGSGISRLQVQLLDAVQIAGGTEITEPGSVTVARDGIVKDDRGAAVAYFVTIRGENGFPKQIRVPAWYSPRRRAMLHCFAPEYAGQTRGYSRIGHCLQEFENIEDLSLAHIKKAIVQSSIALYTKPGEGPPQNPFSGLAHRAGAGPTSSRAVAGGDEITAAANSGRVTYSEIPEATITEPGTVGVFGLEHGDLKPFESSAPHEAFGGFIDAYSSYLSASLSMPFEVYLMRFSSNYSASRGALLLWQRICEIWRGEIVSDFLGPIYEAWLSEEISAGRVRAPGWSDPRLRAAWLSCTWAGAPVPNIDPLRTAEADQKYAELGAQTLDRIARNLNGSSGAANRRKLAREFETLPASPWGAPSKVVDPGGV